MNSKHSWETTCDHGECFGGKCVYAKATDAAGIARANGGTGESEMKTKMTLAELRNMIGMSNTITFAKRMERASQEEIEKELLACINEWLRGDDEPTRLKREKK